MPWCPSGPSGSDSFPNLKSQKQLKSFINRVRRCEGGSEKRQACLSSTCSVGFDNLFQNLLEILFKILCLTRLRALVKGCYHFCLKGGTLKYAFICREYLWKDTHETEGEGNLETLVKDVLFFIITFLCYLILLYYPRYLKTAKITTVPRLHTRPIVRISKFPAVEP